MKTIRPSLVKTFGRVYLSSLFRPTPIWVHLYITRHCNFNCQYCGALDNSRPDPKTEELKARILKVKSLGCGTISFMGGEPTLRKDIVDIVRFCSKNKLYTHMPTNGTFLLVKDNGGRTLLSKLVEAGLGSISLSVDSVAGGFGASSKELPRAKEVLASLIKEKRTNGLAVMLNCVITRENINQVPKMLEFCHTHGLTMVAIIAQDPFPYDSRKNNPNIYKILFSGKDTAGLNKLLAFLTDKNKKGYALGEPTEYYRAIKQWIKGEADWDCGAGKYSMSVDLDGRVAICGYLPYSEINIMDLDRNYYEKLLPEREKYMGWCTKKCLPSCMFCSSFYRQHPLKFLYKKLQEYRPD